MEPAMTIEQLIAFVLGNFTLRPGPKIAASRMPRGHNRQLVLLREQPLDRVRHSGAFDAECAFGAAERRTDREVHRHAVLRCDCPPGNRFGQRRSRRRAHILS